MGILLYKHNQDAFESALYMLSKAGKRLDLWIKMQRKKKEKGTLSEKQAELLSVFGII